jgi:hypothetical protein
VGIPEKTWKNGNLEHSSVERGGRGNLREGTEGRHWAERTRLNRIRKERYTLSCGYIIQYKEHKNNTEKEWREAEQEEG